MSWVWWLGAALVLAVVEILSLDLVLIMFAAAALVTAGIAALGAPLWVQIPMFAITSALLLLAIRPYLLRHLRTRVPLVETNVAAQVGRLGIAVSPVTDRAGRIKLVGEVWTARTEHDEVVTEGADVRVLRIDGATAIVTAHHPTDPLGRARHTDPSPLARPSEETTS